MKNTGNLGTLTFLTESFFSAWALMNAGRLQPGNILTGVFFLLCFLFFRCSAQKERGSSSGCKGLRRTSAAFSSLFTLFYLSVDAPDYLSSLESPLFRLALLTVSALGFFFLFYHLLCFLFAAVMDQKWCEEVLSRPISAFSGRSFFSRCLILYDTHIGRITFLLCILGFLPYFLYQFPGIMTPDSLNQLEQVLGLAPYSNHHPFVHTMLIKLCYWLGSLFTDQMVTAIAFYTFFQLCLMALSAAWLVKTLRRLSVGLYCCLLITFFYGFVPYNGVYAVTIWKDVPFSAGVLLFTTALLRLYLESIQGRLRAATLTVYGIAGLMICLLRSNGWYAYLVSLPFFMYFFWNLNRPKHSGKNKKLLFSIQLATLLLALSVKGPVMNLLQVTPPDLIESLAIPLQQISHVISHDRELTPRQWELVHAVIDTTYLKELYHPRFADNMKELVRAGDPAYLAAHKGDYLKLWLSLGITYPLDYAEAYREQTLGYWYPDSFYTVADHEGISATKLGISHTPLIGGPLVVKAKEIAVKLGGMLPLYGLLWSMGILFWVLLFCMGCGIVRKEYWKLYLYLPGLAVMLTVLIATPVAVEFRYAYSLVYAFPLYLVLALRKFSPPVRE